MECRTATRPLCRAPGLILIAVCVLLLAPALALAVDGVPLYPPGVDAGYAWTSMEHPDMSGPMLAFELFGVSDPSIPPVLKTQTATIYGWNAATGINRTIGGEVPALPDGADQRHPSVIDVSAGAGGRDVYIVWQQQSDPIGGTWDIWLWRGNEQGDTDLGFPMLLIQGPAYSNQYTPDIGSAKTPSGNHLLVTWADDRDSTGTTPSVYLLDITADNNVNGTPDYLDGGFDPATTGARADVAGDPENGQHDPVVGGTGIFWLDERDAAGSGESDVYRADMAAGAPAVSQFWHNADGRVVMSPRATSEGVAWLGPGFAGGPFEPWSRRPGGGAGIVTSLANPQSFDVSGMRFAVTGGHGGNTDGDHDIYFYDKATGQNVPVCNVGAAPGNKLKVQDMPTISYAPGGSRVIWADSRQMTNSAATAPSSLAYELYVALVPTVSENASKTSIKLGKTLTLDTKVTPAFNGYDVKFQTGKRHTFADPLYLGGKLVWYTGWKTLHTKALSGSSKASWTWTPAQKGTYWVRAWFVGGKKYTDVGARKVPHVPNGSRVVKIVVK